MGKDAHSMQPLTLQLCKSDKMNTHVADPDDLVGGGVGPDLAGEVDVAALRDAARVDVRAEGEDHSRRI